LYPVYGGPSENALFCGGILRGNIDKILGSAVLFMVLTACGGGGSGGGGAPAADNDDNGNPSVSGLAPDTSPDPALPAPDSPGYAEAKEAARFLMQASFGPTAKSIDQLTAANNDYTAWINAQIALPQTFHLPLLEDRFAEIGLARAPVTEDALEAWLRDMQRSDIWWESVTWGEDQLRQRVAYALSQILVISNVSDALFNDARGIANYHDILAAHAFGNFRDLLEQVTMNPMMGQYLSMQGNEKADPAQNIRPDENYAREIMQLFSIGLVELNVDGSVQLDEGDPIPTYGQDDIKELARVFTGWTHNSANYWGHYVDSGNAEIRPMKAFLNFHDIGAKTVLGQPIDAGQSPAQDIDSAMDILFFHPNTAPFISKQLIQRLVTSNPSPAYVARVATVFNDNGAGVKGDLAAVVKAILLDDEARQGQLAAPETFGKLKEPMLKVSALWRAFKAQGVRVMEEDGTFSRNRLRYRGTDRAYDQRPYGSPSVFNFYRPDYSHPGEIKNAGLYAPEFQIHTERQFISGINSIGETIFYRDAQEPSAQTEYAESDWDLYAPRLYLVEEKALADTPSLLLDRINLLLMAGDMSFAMYTGILDYLNAQPIGTNGNRQMMIYDALYLVCASPEFAVQR
jgi:uncharacterized protein (DUF1800 family)